MNETIKSFILLLLLIAIIVFSINEGKKRRKKYEKISKQNKSLNRINKIYSGYKGTAYRLFEVDKEKASNDGYYPISENYVEGSYSGGDFLVAILLCFFLIGIFVFLYMLIIKPKGKLMVVYQKGKQTKTCPLCAEEVNPQAKICKHCGSEFVEVNKLL